MGQLTVSQDTDFRGGSAETLVDKIQFVGANNATAIFSANQFGPDLISNDVTFAGTSSINRVQVYFANQSTTFSAADWKFQNWSEDDSIFVVGKSGNDTFTGSNQRDQFVNGGGLDHIDLGNADDVLQVNAALAVGSTVDGGLGFDRAGIFKDGTSDLRGTNFSSVEELRFAYDDQTVLLSAAQIGHSDGFQLVHSRAANASHIEVQGTSVSLSSVTFGSWGSEDSITIRGTSPSGNLLIGSSQADRLIGSSGTDEMRGASGNDTYVVDNLGDAVFEAKNDGNDLVESAVSFTLAGQYIEQLTLTGTAAVNGTGNTLNNTLTGNSAANVLAGKTGDDTYVVQNAADTVIESDGQGSDLVQSSVSFSLKGQYIEKLTLTGSQAINATGNTLNNVINGNSAANSLDGHTGADLLKGGGGRDTITPGSDTATDHVVISMADSTGATRDNIVSFDANGEDKLDLYTLPTAMVTMTAAGVLNAASFNQDIAAAVDGALDNGGACQAILFNPSAGDLDQTGHLYLIVDANNDGSYVSGEDYVIEFTNMTGTLDLSDFI